MSRHRNPGRWLLPPHTTAFLVITLLTCASCATRVQQPGPVTLVGLVLDEHHRPVAGALLRLGVRSAISDTFGRFRLEDVAPGHRRLIVEARGHESTSEEVIVEGHSMLVRVRLQTVDGVVDQAIAAIERGARPELLQSLLSRLRTAAPDDSRTHLLARIVEVSP